MITKERIKRQRIAAEKIAAAQLGAVAERYRGFNDAIRGVPRALAMAPYLEGYSQGELARAAPRRR